MRLKDISLVSQGMEESQNALKSGIDSATDVFDSGNTLASQGIQQSQANLKSQMDQATQPFANNNMMIDQGINQVKSGLANQITQATSPFENKNSLMSMAMEDMGSLLKDKDDAFSLSNLSLLSKEMKPKYTTSKSRYFQGDFQYGG